LNKGAVYTAPLFSIVLLLDDGELDVFEEKSSRIGDWSGSDLDDIQY